MQYNADYYKENKQNKDRIALAWYGRLIKKMKLQPTYLDLGAGVGHLSKRLNGKKYSLENNAFALEQIQLNSPNSIVISDQNEINEPIQTIVALHVFEHLNDFQINDFLNYLDRKNFSATHILVVTPALHGTAHRIKKNKWEAFKDPTHINLKTSELWDEIFLTFGYASVIKFADGFYDFPYSRSIFKNLKFGIKTVAQLILAKPFLKVNDGENNILLYSKIMLQK
jgi:hypothetical protein